MSEPTPQSRDHLARVRTRLANERTGLAWLRTAIMLLVSGATVLKLFGTDPSTVTTGVALMGLGGVLALVGLLRFLRIDRSLR